MSQSSSGSRFPYLPIRIQIGKSPAIEQEEAPSGRGHLMRRPRQPTLTLTLAALTVALLLVTVAAVVAVATTSANRVREDYEQRLLGFTSFSVATIAGRYLAPATPLLEEARYRAGRSTLGLDDPEALAEYLVDRVRFEPDVSFFYFGDQATGRFSGAWRRADGAIILARSSPEVDGGRRSEWEVTPAWERVPFQRELPDGYDPRLRPWYDLALGSTGVAWTDPYPFFDGRPGLTAALALRDASTGAPRGVFGVDFALDQTSAYLAEAAQGRTRIRQPLLAVVTRDGKILASSLPAGSPEAAALLAAVLVAAPSPPATLPLRQLTRYSLDFDGTGYLATLQAERLSDALEALVVVIVPSDEFYAIVNQTVRFAAGVGLAIVVVAVVLCVLLARRLSLPLRLIAADLQRVGRFELSSDPAPRSFVREIVVVSDTVDRMKASLRSFGHYVPTQLVQEVLASGEEAQLGGSNRVLTLFFSDIEGFTGISESLPPASLVEHLGEYLQAMTTILQAEGGTVDKFIGDGILALFNAPREIVDHPAAACRAALRAQQRLDVLAREWAARGRPDLRTRIGLHSGEVIVGNIGTPERFEYTVMGDAVNLASRLEGLNKVYGTRIMASLAVREAAGPGFEWRRLDRVAVVGRAGGTLVSELLGQRGEVDPALLQARDRYEQALGAYFARNFAFARGAFRSAAAERSADRAAAIMAERSADLEREPPPEDWDGVYRATQK